MGGEELEKILKAELSGNFEDVVVGMMRTPAEFDAHCIHDAINGAGTNEKCIVEILASRTNTQIQAITAEYARKYGHGDASTLTKDLKGDLGKTLRRLCIALSQGHMPESGADAAKADKDAHSLFKAGEGSWGTDESAFQDVLMTSSPAQLVATSARYVEVSGGHDIYKAIKKEYSGVEEDCLIMFWEIKTNPAKFFANRLYKSMKGAGTDDKTLQRVVISRSEVDMVQIKASFMEQHHKALANMIKDDCSGDYKKVLFRLIGESA